MQVSNKLTLNGPQADFKHEITFNETIGADRLHMPFYKITGTRVTLTWRINLSLWFLIGGLHGV